MNAERPAAGTTGTPGTLDESTRNEAARAYRACLRDDAVLGRMAETYVPTVASSPLGPTDSLETVLDASRLMLIGAPGSGKTTTLKVALLHYAGQVDETTPAADIAVYVDLTDARPGEGVEDLIARALSAGAGPNGSALLTPSWLLIDNLDRATDVYLLEGLELLLRAGGRAGPSVVMACREADWPAYRSWFEDVPNVVLQPLAPQAVTETLTNALPDSTATAAKAWLARDRALATAVRSPLGLAAFVGAVRDRSPDGWRRGQVLDALLEAGLSHVPSGERSSYRSALADVALDSLGQGRLVEVDTIAMGLGVTRDEMIRTGLVVARGSRLEFVEPLLAQHCAAKRLADRAAANPKQLADRLGDLHDPRRADTMVHVFHLAPDPVSFTLALLPLPGGPELVSRCLTEPDAADPAGPNGVSGLVNALCDRAPEIGAPALYRLGEALHRSGHDDAAEVALRAALDRSGDGDDLNAVFLRPDVDDATPVDQWVREFLAKRNRGLAMRGMRDMASSADSLAEADEALDKLNADIAFERGVTAYEDGDLAAATIAFETVLDAEPHSARCLYHYGRTLLAVGRAEEAVRHLTRARELAPGRAEIEAALGDAYREQGQLDQALQSLLAAGEMAPGDAAVVQATGEVHAELGDFEAAAAAMQQAVAAQPTEADWHDGLGQVLLEIGRTAAAVGAFRVACSLAPQEPRHLRHLGSAHLEAGEQAEATAVFRKAIDMHPDDGAALAGLGRALAATGSDAEALDALRRAVSADSDWPEDHLHLARILRAQGELDDALVQAKRAAELAPASARVFAELGRVHDARGEAPEAVDAYSRAVALAPEDEETRSLVAAVRRELEDEHENARAAATTTGPGAKGPATAAGVAAAAAHLGADDKSPLERLADQYEQLAAGGPTASPETISTLAQAQEATAQEATAQEVAAQEVRVQEASDLVAATTETGLPDATRMESEPDERETVPDDVARAAAQGAALRKEGRFEEAVQTLEAAWRDEENCGPVLAQLGMTYEAMGRDKDAMEAFGVAAESGSLQPLELAHYSGVARRLGENDMAIDTAREAVSTQPGWADAYAVLGEAYAAAGLTEGALMAMRRAAELAPGEPTYRTSQARLAQTLGQRSEAIEALEEGIAKSPTSPDLYLALGRAYEEQGRNDDAQAAYDRAAALAPDQTDRRHVAGDPMADDATDGSVKSLRDVVATSPDDAAARHELGLMLMRAGDLDSALVPLQRAAHLVPDEAAYQRSLGQCLAGLGQPGAADALKASLALDPGSAATHAALAEVLTSMNSLPAAQDALVAATRLEPERAAYWRALGALRLTRQDSAGAAEALTEAVRLDPSDDEAAALLRQAKGETVAAPALSPDRPSGEHTVAQDVSTVVTTAAEADGVVATDAAATIQSLEQALIHQPDDAELLVALSTASVRADHIEDAKRYARRATECAATSAAAWLALGVAQRAAGDRTAAVAAAERAIGIEPSDRAATLLKAELAEDLGDVGTALEAYGRLVGDGQADAVTSVRFGELAAAQGWFVPLLLPYPSPSMDQTHVAAATTALENVLAIGDETMTARAASALAVVHGRSGNMEQAVLAAEKAVAAQESPDTLATLAWTQMLNQTPDDALTSLAGCRALGDDDARVHWLTARAHRDRGEPELALVALRAALEHEPSSAGLLADLGATHLDLGQVDDAVEAYDEAMQRDGSVRIVCGAARAARLAGQPHESISMLSRAADRTPPDAELLHETALAHGALGNESTALESLEKACQLAPGRAAYWAGLSQMYREQGRIDEARQSMCRATDLEPKNLDYMLTAADLAIAAQEYDDAQDTAELLLKEPATKVAAHALFGKVALARGDTNTAQHSFEQAVGLEPSSAEMHHLLGVAAKSAGDSRTAMDHLETATRLAPASVDTYVALGEVYASEGLLDDAVQALQQAVVCDPDSSEAHLRLGAICGEAGLTDKSLASLQKAIELNPDDYRPRYAMAQAYVKASEPQQAVTAYEDAIEKSDDAPDVLFGAGLAYKGMRDYGRAAELFRQVTQVSPKNAAAYTQLAAVSALHFLDRVTAERNRD